MYQYEPMNVPTRIMDVANAAEMVDDRDLLQEAINIVMGKTALIAESSHILVCLNLLKKSGVLA